jgi:hypothetical protein
VVVASLPLCVRPSEPVGLRHIDHRRHIPLHDGHHVPAFHCSDKLLRSRRPPLVDLGEVGIQACEEALQFLLRVERHVAVRDVDKAPLPHRHAAIRADVPVRLDSAQLCDAWWFSGVLSYDYSYGLRLAWIWTKVGNKQRESTEMQKCRTRRQLRLLVDLLTILPPSSSPFSGLLCCIVFTSKVMRLVLSSSLASEPPFLVVAGRYSPV